MAPVAHLDHPFQPRISGSATAVGGVLFVLSAAAPLAAPLRSAFAAWREQRRRNEEARQLRELASTDSRIMADLVALGQTTPPEWY